MRAIRGAALTFHADPFVLGDDAAATYESDALILLEGGKIAAFGPYEPTSRRMPPGTPIAHYRDALILPGFIDCHTHYPQLQVIASYGKTLLEWLEAYTFPHEARFADEALCRETARLFLDETVRNGITTAAVYGTVHAQSADAFFAEAAARNRRMIAGKVLMDRNAPPALIEDARAGYDSSKRLIDRWHGKGRCLYAITPRFAPTSSPAQLDLAGALWRESRGAYLQSHLAETKEEIAWVRKLFPDSRSYLAVYDRFGLLGERAIYGHGIHLDDADFRRLHKTGTALAHCPTSNSFLGSGLFDMARAKERARPVPVGLATDVGGGFSFSMLATMAEAYKIARFAGRALSPAQALYLATRGAAAALKLEDKIGSLVVGHEADLAILDLKSTPLIGRRMTTVASIWQALFLQMMLGGERAVRAAYVAGELAYDRDAAA
jgi:guanine deaminase